MKTAPTIRVCSLANMQPQPTICGYINIHTTLLGMLFLHLLPELGLVLSIPDAHLFKQDIARVEHSMRISLHGALLFQKRSQLSRRERFAIRYGAVFAQGAAKGRLGHARLLEDGTDLRPNAVAGFVDGDPADVFAGQGDVADVQKVVG